MLLGVEALVVGTVTAKNALSELLLGGGVSALTNFSVCATLANFYFVRRRDCSYVYLRRILIRKVDVSSVHNMWPH